MELDAAGFLTLSVRITFGALILSFLLAVYRLVKGPSLPDRVVAIDLITNITMAILALSVVANDLLVAMDVVGVLALVTFLGTIAFAMHLEKEVRHD